ncbi:MAG: hypothetical protein ACLFS6_09740 [Methanomassiliicoccales archaeon]
MEGWTGEHGDRLGGILSRNNDHLFGLATDRTAAVPSSRIDPGFWEVPAYQREDPGIVPRLCRKVLLHELKHALDLGHCPREARVMRLSDSRRRPLQWSGLLFLLPTPHRENLTLGRQWNGDSTFI